MIIFEILGMVLNLKIIEFIKKKVMKKKIMNMIF
jgi:hypothetical protein